MRIDNPPFEQLVEYYKTLDACATKYGALQWIKYIDLGTHIIRLISYSDGFTSHVERQLGYVLKDSANHYDASLVIWQEKGIDALIEAQIPYPRRRIEKMLGKPPSRYFQVFDHTVSPHHPVFSINARTRRVDGWNPEENICYYGAENLAPEEFIKHGHIFVQILGKLLKTPHTELVHGAVVGLNGKGVLLCARGQRGKSTLAVRAMLDGFDYVADDYLVLSREESGLYAWPIYSIITLSPMMWSDLYDTLDAKFVSNNARKDKYVFNIDNYRERFVSRYPIQCCMFPQIVAEPEPSVVQCTRAGKGRAITQLIYSTIKQMGDLHDRATIKKLIEFVRDLPCYQINLCRDINKNLCCLRDFLENGKYGQQVTHPGMLHSCSVSGVQL